MGNVIDIFGKTQIRSESSTAHTSRTSNTGDAHAENSSAVVQATQVYPHSEPNHPGVPLSRLRTRFEREKGRLNMFQKTGPSSKVSEKQRATKRDGDQENRKGQHKSDGDDGSQPEKPRRRYHSPPDDDDNAISEFWK